MKRRQEAVSQEMLHLFLVMQNSFLFSKHFHTHFVSCRGGVHDVFNNLSRVFHFVTCGSYCTKLGWLEPHQFFVQYL